MKLYYSPGSCALSPHIALREAGLDFEPVNVSLEEHRFGDGSDYYAVNALGYVPLLELDDGSRLRESAAILQYIADQAPASDLAPANGTPERYRLQEWLHFIASEIHSPFYPVFEPDTAESFKETARAKLRGRFEWVESQLDGTDYLTGDRFSIADAYLFTLSNWAGLVGVDLGGLPRLEAWRARVAARPAVQEALKLEES